MRASMILGLLLILFGGFVLVRGMSYKKTEEVARVGDVRITDTDKHRVPQWVGIAALVGGAALLAGTAMGKK